MRLINKPRELLEKIKLNQYLSYKVLTILCVLLIIALSLLSISLFKAQKKISRLEKGNSAYLEETKNLSSLNRTLIYPPQTYTFDPEGERFSDELWDFSLICSNDWVCKVTDHSYITTKDKQGRRVSSIFLFRLNDQKLNNPNYDTPMDWFNGMLRKETEAIGSNLDEMYGAKYAEDAGGVTLPFYRGYDLTTLNPLFLNNILSLAVVNADTDVTDTLVPNNETVYLFRTSGDDLQNMETYLHILNSIEFK